MSTDSFLKSPATLSATEEDIWDEIPDVDRVKQEFFRLVEQVNKAV